MERYDFSFEGFEDAANRINIPTEYEEEIKQYWTKDDLSFVNFVIGLLL